MFFVGITDFDLAEKFSDNKLETFKFQDKVLTIIYDNFISKIVSDGDDLCVIESPLLFNNNAREIVLSQARINIQKGTVKVSRPSTSGRPIYFHQSSQGDFYCSTNISILKQAGVPISENSAVLPEFFVFRYVMAPNTLLKKIYQLQEFSTLYVAFRDGKCITDIVNEFNPHVSKKLNDFRDFREKIYALVKNSLEPLGVAKDRLAILLSGGLDSSLLLRICRDLNFEIKETYSTGWPFENYEKEYAQSSADFFGTTHKYHEITLDQYLRGFVESISATEQPLPHMQSVLLYLLFRDRLPRNKDIILNGAGTELSCNSTNFMAYQFQNKLPKIELLKLMGKFPFASRWKGSRWAVKYQSSIECGIEDPNSVLWTQDPIGSMRWAADFFNVKQKDIICSPLEVLKRFGDHSFYEIVAIFDYIGANHATESTWSMIGESQRKIVYYPFNNTTLVNYLLSVPDDIKYKKYKYVFKEVGSYCGLPKFIVYRHKLGFNPLTNMDLLKTKVFDPLSSLSLKVFNTEQIRRVNPTDWGYDFWTLWNILNYSIWKRLWIYNEPKEVLLQEFTAT